LENSETHVNMPSGLHEQTNFVERRTNVAEVLRSAIERDPDRIDLRVKLMELYHATAAINRQGFIDAARRLAQQPNYQSTPEWEKVAAMGRQVAPEDPLFALDPTVQHEKLDEKLANCA
jgi:Tfp pilus assembly protein FimV